MLGGRRLQVSASMVIPGELLRRKRTGPVGHRVEVAWATLGPPRVISRRGLSQRAHLQRLRTEILPVLTWGDAIWY